MRGDRGLSGPCRGVLIELQTAVNDHAARSRRGGHWRGGCGRDSWSRHPMGNADVRVGKREKDIVWLTTWTHLFFNYYTQMFTKVCHLLVSGTWSVFCIQTDHKIIHYKYLNRFFFATTLFYCNIKRKK